MLQGLGAPVGGVLVVVAVTVLLVVGITRFTSGAEAQARRDAGAGESAASGVLGEIVEIFQPSRVHVTEEKERQRLDVVQRPAEGRPFDVNLDDGVCYVPQDDLPPDAGAGTSRPGGPGGASAR